MRRILLFFVFCAAADYALAQTPAMTNGEFAIYIRQQYRLPEPAHPFPFADVPPNSKYFAATQAIYPHLHRNLLCPGCMISLNFLPDNPISRAEAAIVITSILVARGSAQILSPSAARDLLAKYPDANSIPVMARPYLATAVKIGALVAPGGALQPYEALSQKQVAAAVSATTERK